MVLFPPAVLHNEGPLEKKKKNNIKSAVKLLLFILGDHKNEWSWNRTESLRSGWPYIFSLWARWKTPFAIFCSAEAIHKSKGWGGLPWLCLWRNSYAVTWCNCRKLNWVWGMIIIPLCHQQSKTTPRSGFCFNLSTTFKNAYINTGLLLH